MLNLLYVLGLATILAGALLWRRYLGQDNTKTQADRYLKDLRSLKGRHEVAAVLSELIDKDGAGAWPPKANHDSWPAALRPYKDIYLDMVPHLPAATPSLDEDVNIEKIANFRCRMQKLLTERINIPEVEKLMASIEAGNWDELTRGELNGFYCCVAVCRHAYRWGTIPVVKAAQAETTLDFPPELDAPWPYLQRNFGVTADSGNNTANVLHNFNEKGERVYKINVGLSEKIQSSEDAFFRLFHDLEKLALPVYYEMVHSIIAYEENNKPSCLQHLQLLTAHVRELLKVFYEGLTEQRVSRDVWLSYVQGFQGWGVGRMINGEFVKYDGLSGNHILVFQAMDAFLGLDRYLTDENMVRYIPARQRELSLVFKKYCVRGRLEGEVDEGIKEEITKIVNHLKVFRAAHRTRVVSYLKQPAPERMSMTAGKSVILAGLNEFIKVLDGMMAGRLRQTV